MQVLPSFMATWFSTQVLSLGNKVDAAQLNVDEQMKDSLDQIKMLNLKLDLLSAQVNRTGAKSDLDIKTLAVTLEHHRMSIDKV